MDLDEFKESMQTASPPDGLPAALTALWHEAKGDWQLAHEIAQEENDAAGAWVHAYLHRKEGDLSNAAYWYRRAGRPAPRGTANEEWTFIVKELLQIKVRQR